MAGKAVIVGAGITGLSVALELAMKGYETLTIEQGPGPGWGATGRAAGIITRQVYLKHDLELIHETLGFLRENYEWLVYPRVGLTLYDSAGGLAGCMSWLIDRWEKLRVQYSILKPETLRGVLPGYNIKEKDRGLATPGDVQVDVGSLSATMAGDVEREGGGFWFNTSVYDFHVIGDTVVLDTSRGPVEADLAVIAAGPWNPRLVPSLRGRVHVYRCQLHSISVPPPEEFVVFAADEGFYHAPESSGRSLIGDGCEFLADPEEGLQPSIEMIARLGERVEARIPGALESGLESVWSAACDVAMDGLPYAGKVDGLGRVWVVGGLDGYGVMRAPAIARRLVRTILGGVLPFWLSLDRVLRYRVPGRRAVLELHSPRCGEPPECI